MQQLRKIHNKNYKADSNVLFCLTKFKGISFNLGNYILYKLNIDKNKKIKELSQSEVLLLESILDQNIVNLKIPQFYVTDHILELCPIETNIKIVKQRNVVYKKSIKNYVGMRHILGQKVRGQKTKSTGRINKKMKGFKARKK